MSFHPTKSRRPDSPSKACVATYCIISLISVAIFQFRPPATDDNSRTALWLILGPWCIWLTYSALDHYLHDNGRCFQDSVTKDPHGLYSFQVSLLLPLLGTVATWIQTNLAVTADDANLGADLQACAIHFALSYFVISECEFYRMYWLYRGRKIPLPYRAILKMILEANRDPDFPGCRDCTSLPDIAPISNILQNEAPRWCSNVVLRVALDLLMYHVRGMCTIVYLVRWLLGVPEPDCVTFWNFQVLYISRHPCYVLLDMLLQRPLRLIYSMQWMALVGLGERLWQGWHDKRNSHVEI